MPLRSSPDKSLSEPPMDISSIFCAFSAVQAKFECTIIIIFYFWKSYVKKPR